MNKVREKYSKLLDTKLLSYLLNQRSLESTKQTCMFILFKDCFNFRRKFSNTLIFCNVSMYGLHTFLYNVLQYQFKN